MTDRTRIDRYVAELSRRLGWRRLIERRALIEIRDHLESAARAHRGLGMSEVEAQEAAVEALGTVEQSVSAVVDSNGALRVLEMTKDRLVLIACALTLPGLILLGLSFVTFNFPCSQVEQEAALHVYQRCGVPSLQFLRPWLADVGLYGMATWYQLTQLAVTTLGPLAAAILLLRAQTHVRSEGPDRTVVIVQPVVQRVVVLALATTVFLAVSAYKLAG